MKVPDKEILNLALIKPHVNACIAAAKLATCLRARCGAVVISKHGRQLGFGYNHIPQKDAGHLLAMYTWIRYLGTIRLQKPDKHLICRKDSLPVGFKSDKTCCIHAEQMAIIEALKNNGADDLNGGTIFFVRIDKDGNPEYAGEPWCTICSKLALDVGIERFVLYQVEGWTAYETEYYNELSFQYVKK